MSSHEIEFEPDEAPQAELVHWMEPRHLRVGPAGLSGAVAGAFVLGALTAVGVLALARALDLHDWREAIASRVGRPGANWTGRRRPRSPVH